MELWGGVYSVNMSAGDFCPILCGRYGRGC